MGEKGTVKKNKKILIHQQHASKYFQDLSMKWLKLITMKKALPLKKIKCEMAMRMVQGKKRGTGPRKFSFGSGLSGVRAGQFLFL
jgi:tmRNA-binding protein